ncbi:MAG TPA: YceH family protein [Candidatus Aquilonibacter sp.]|nr:YceH family protein [Candidatus Aquilonibacter sp.]
MVVRVGLLNEAELNEIKLNVVEVRVLGSLIEKDITTPDYYPLSLNALLNACNQKNNREPVMSLDEDAVRSALESLQAKRLAGPASGADSRVTKYEHRLQEAFNFDRRETAVLCVLLLRGAQTPGELRGRAERMYRFEALEDVHATLERLSQRQPPLVAVLPRQPGTKESRYIHLLSGAEVAGESSPIESSFFQTAANSADESVRLGDLENQVAALKREIAGIREQLAEFRKQFE